jgi:histidinol-phosphate aminotransferase
MPRTFAGPGDHGVVSDHAFVVYRLAMMSQGLDFTSVPMAPGLVHDLAAMNRSVTSKTRLLFVANPNNPTGTHVGRTSLERLLNQVPEDVIVVVDEAYVEYAQASDFVSALELRSLRERLIICRTFSKCYGLAGLRVGYAVGPSQLIGYLNRVRDPFNSNLLGQAAAEAALGDTSFVERSVSVNEEGRGLMETGLGQLESKGVTWVPSQTNFLLIRTPHLGVDIYDRMLRLGVIVRPMAGYGLDHHLRITLGTSEQVRRCLGALGDSLDKMERG